MEGLPVKRRLYSEENPDGELLEAVLDDLIAEMEEKQAKEPCRETALVITNLEQALLWQYRRGVKRGTATMALVRDPREP